MACGDQYPSNGTYMNSNQGWECPKCHKCYAPSVTECRTCGGWTWTWHPATLVAVDPRCTCGQITNLPCPVHSFTVTYNTPTVSVTATMPQTNIGWMTCG